MKDYISRVYPSASLDIQKNPWYVDMKTGIYGKLNWDNKSIQNIGFVGLDAWGYSKYSDVICYSNRLYFISRWNDSSPIVLVKDTEGNSVKEIKLKRLPIRKQSKAEPFFSICFLEGDYIYSLACSYPAIVRIDARTLEVKYVNEWVQAVEQYADARTVWEYYSACSG